MTEQIIYIPIGYKCHVSLYLRDNGLRREAFPFDWNVNSITTVFSLIRNNFEGFLEIENLHFLPPAERILVNEDGEDVMITDDIITPVACTRYGILFPHDFSEAGIDDYADVKNKYNKRINRLMNALETRQNIEFIFSLDHPNKWHIKQFESVGITFKIDTEEDVINGFKSLGLSNVTLRSLDQLKSLT